MIFRHGSVLTALVAIVLLYNALSAVAADQSRKPGQPGEVRLYIGTYTRGDSQGIYLSRLDLATGRLQPPELAAEVASDNIVVFRIDRQTGRLSPTGQSIKVSMPVCVMMMPLGR